MAHKIHPIKYPFIFIIYIWLRLDPILFLAFRRNWTPRFEFMASIFGEKDAEKFLKHRVKLVKARNKKRAEMIQPHHVEKATNQFLSEKFTTKTGKLRRKTLIKKLLRWATDKEINESNIDSYKSRSSIIDSLLGPIFQNSLGDEPVLIFEGLKKIVFSRITYLGSKGEPSPVVHNVIISGVGRLLATHFSELDRIRDEKLDKMTKVKLIKEIKDVNKERGSLAFSAENVRSDDDFRHKFPLSDEYVNLLHSILSHYRFSAWPDSRDKANELIDSIESNLGFCILKDSAS